MTLSRGKLIWPGSLLAFGAVALSASCSPSAEPRECAPAASPAFVQTYSAGEGGVHPLTVVVAVDRIEITPADRITLTLEATGGPDAVVVLPEIGEKLGEFTVASTGVREMPRGMDGPSHRLTVVLEPFLIGKKRIPALEVRAGPGGASGATTIKTNPIDVDVRSVIAPSDVRASLSPAKGPVSIPSDHSAGAWMPASIAGASLLVFAGAWCGAWFNARQSRTPVIDAAEAARLELTALATVLESPAPGSPADTRSACASLNACLRRFVQRRFGVPAPSWSVAQLQRAPWPRSRPISDESRAEMLAILSTIDALRFTPEPPERPNVRQLVRRARDWLERVDALSSASSATLTDPAILPRGAAA